MSEQTVERTARMLRGCCAQARQTLERVGRGEAERSDLERELDWCEAVLGWLIEAIPRERAAWGRLL